MKLPENFPERNINIRNDELINSVWVSIAVGSEHYTFTNMRKNIYEEALFKCEDERFEFDININLFKKSLKMLESIRDNKNPEDCKKIMDRVLRLKVLQGLYGGKLNEFLEDYEKEENHSKILEVFIERIKNKVI